MGLPFMAKSVVALHIEANHITLAAAKGRRLVAQWTSALPPGLVHNGEPDNPPALVGEIKAAFKEAGVGNQPVVVCFSGLGVIVRSLDLPPMPKSLISETIAREARHGLGTMGDDMVITGQIVSQKKAERMRALAIGVPRAKLDAMVGMLRAARMRLVAVDIKPLALARAINTPIAAIVHREADSLDLVLVINDIPVAYRSVGMEALQSSDTSAIDQAAVEMLRTIRVHNEAHRLEPFGEGAPIFATGNWLTPDMAPARLAEATGLQPGALAIPMDLPEMLHPAEVALSAGLLLREV